MTGPITHEARRERTQTVVRESADVAQAKAVQAYHAAMIEMYGSDWYPKPPTKPGEILIREPGTSLWRPL